MNGENSYKYLFNNIWKKEFEDIWENTDSGGISDLYKYDEKTDSYIKRNRRDVSRIILEKDIDKVLDRYNDYMLLYKMFGDVEYKEEAKRIKNIFKTKKGEMKI